MGLTVLDAGVVIGWLSSEDRHHVAAGQVLRNAVHERDQLVLPASAFAEVLVGVWAGGREAVAAFRSSLARVPIEVEELTEPRALLAGQVRAMSAPSLKLPDAMVVATAVDLDADRLVTTDRRWGDLAKVGFRGVLDVL